MSEFEPYQPPEPGANADPTDGDDEQYVLIVTSALNQGMMQPSPVSEPMTWAQANAVLDDIVAGKQTQYLNETGDLVAEVARGHLVVSTEGTMFTKANAHEIRIARVLRM